MGAMRRCGRKRCRLVTIVAALAGLPGVAPAGEPVRTFYNVLAPDGADPWVIRQDGYYYMTYTIGDAIELVRSRTLSGLEAGERRRVWQPPRTGPTSRNIWAPEVHRLRGRWYIYFAADDGRNENHRMYALENPSADPFAGSFTLKGKMAPPGDDHWAIDGTAFEAAGRLYFVWSGWPGNRDVEQVLYIAPMSDPLTIDGPRVAISRPEWGWETYDSPNVNEGPVAHVRDGRVALVYAASGAWTSVYCLGMLTAREDDDLLDPCSWTKRPEPVLRNANGIVAPGHPSLVRSPDEREDWIIYHTGRWPGSSWSRQVRAQPFRWEGGAPVFGAPSPPDEPIALPGGEPERLRFECEDAGEGRPDPTASSGSKRPGSSFELAIPADRDGPRGVAIRYAWGEERERRPGRLRIAANGEAPRDVRLPVTAGRWSVTYATVPLRAGNNTIRLEAEGRAEFDCLDLLPAP